MANEPSGRVSFGFLSLSLLLHLRPHALEVPDHFTNRKTRRFETPRRRIGCSRPAGKNHAEFDRACANNADW